ncbi:ATP-binding protein [Aestuariirhabdus sp. LZHN29]|uniref:ATP-binding protein n=1 Tax=Aestuariirhabdus sp. LZHN29 TaxID=3417462 RepID=UPI003CEB2DD9
MKVKTQYLLIPLFTAILVGYVAFSFFATQGTQSVKITNLYESYSDTSDTLSSYRDQLIEQHLALMANLSEAATDQQRDTQLRIGIGEIETLVDLISHLRQRIAFDDSALARLDRIGERLEQYLNSLGTVAQGLADSNPTSAEPDPLSRANTAFKAAIEDLGQFLEGHRQQGVGQLLRIQEQTDQELFRLGMLLLITISFILLSSWILSRQLEGSIGQLVSSLAELSRGNTDVRIPATSSNNEFSEIFSAVGTFRSTLINFRDSQQELNHRSLELERLLSTIPGMAYRCEKSNTRNLLMASAGCIDLTGYRPEQLTDSKLVSFGSIIHRDDLPRVLDQIEDATTHQRAYQLTYRIVTLEKDIRWVLERGMEVYNDETSEVTLEGLVIDITERKQAEEEVQRLNAQLEDRVEERTQDLQQSVQRLTELQSQLIESEKQASLGNLVAGVAHEINTPIGICITAASHLERSTAELLSKIEDQELKRSELVHFMSILNEGLQLIQNNIRITSDLISSFKLMAADKNNEEMRDFYLHEYLGEMIKGVTPRLQTDGHRVDLRCPDNLMLHSYPGAFYQIITNLVNNSIEHGFAHTPNGQITIDVESSDKLVRLVYSDNGIGVNDEVRKRIFEPFFSASATRSKGLGLNIVYNTVTQMLQGQIHCSSEPGHGICFEIEVPLRLNSGH